MQTDPCASPTRKNEEDGTKKIAKKSRDELMTRAWPRIAYSAYCALESVTTRSNATFFVLNACRSVANQAWTRRKMGGKVGLICGSCWSGKYSMYTTILHISNDMRCVYVRGLSFLSKNCYLIGAQLLQGYEDEASEN